MAYQIIININGSTTTIDEDHIIQAITVVKNRIKFNFDDLIAPETEFVLDASDNTYNPDNSSSIFFGAAWYNQQVSIYKDGLLLWDGRLKKIAYDGAKKTLLVKTKNYVQEIVDVDCHLTQGTGADYTPAQIILEILQDWVKIPDSNINQIGFANGRNIQESLNCYYELRGNQEDPKQASNLILELCRTTGAYIYSENNIINYFQPQAYAGELGEVIKSSDIIAKSFKVEFDDKEIVNFADGFFHGYNNNEVFYGCSEEYTVTLDCEIVSGSPIITVNSMTLADGTNYVNLPANSADYLKVGNLITNRDEYSVLFPGFTTIDSIDIPNNQITLSENATGNGSNKALYTNNLEPSTAVGNYIKDSYDIFGRKPFKIIKNTPSDETDVVANHTFLFRKKSGTDIYDVLSLKTTLNSSLIKYCSFSMDYNKNYIKLNDQLDLLFDNYVREPVRVIEKKIDVDKKKVTVKCQFLNSPYEHYSRDVTSPDKIKMFSFFYDANKIVSIWGKQASDVSYYKQYLGYTESYYNAVVTEGFSPISIPTPSTNNNNQSYKLLSGATEYKYFTKITAFDSSENESDDSVIFQPINIEDGTNEKRYKITSASEIYLGIQAQPSHDYDLIDYQELYGDDVYGGTTTFGSITGYNDYPGTWVPDTMTYYDGVDYDETTYSFMGCFQTGIIANQKGFSSITWKLDQWNDATYVQYREYDTSTNSFGSWSSFQNTTNRYFKVNLGGIKAVQFRIYLPDDNVKVYLENIEQTS